MKISDHGKRHIALFDTHIPKNRDLKPVLDFASKGVDHFILGGDIFNLEWASHWNERFFKDLGRMKLRQMLYQELDAAQPILKDIRKAVGKKCQIHYIPGNHESWLWYACFYHRLVEVPWDLSSITFKSDVSQLLNKGLGELLGRLIDSKKHNINVLDYNDPLKIGKITYLHGHQFGSQRPTAASVKLYPGSSLVFGHHHKHEVTPTYNQGDSRKCYEHIAVPCMTGLAPGYLKNRSTTWMNGFYVADFLKNGMFDGRVKKVLDGRTVP